ncbi:hypothetical protein [Devriesea agamarum]|uniref:hypothetical protein n=1 Tax=Devriesea agamarum TaxID=472569 RepID=UPI0012ED2BEF|nr:hypothetical protein [Devriesea agamarum]
MTALQNIVDNVQIMVDAAHREDERRTENNDWVEWYNNRWEITKKWHEAVGKPEPPNLDKLPGPAFKTANLDPLPRFPGHGAVGGGGAANVLRKVAGIAGRGSRIVQPLRSTAVRGALANGFSGAAGNVTSTALDPNADHSLQGYASAAGRGFVVNGVGSFAAGKIALAVGSQVADKLPQLDKVVSSTARHAAPRNIGGIIGEQFADRIVGGITSVGNAALAPGNQNPQELLNAAIEGIANGGGGPTAGLHAKVSTPVRSMHEHAHSTE